MSGFHGLYDYWIVKLDIEGNIQWQKCLGGSYDEIAYSIQQTKNKGYITVGYTISNDGDISCNPIADDIWVVKLDSLGDITWQKCLGGSDYENAYSIKETFEGGYILAGYTASEDGDVSGIHSDNEDYWIVKLDSSGSLEWQKCLGGYYDDIALSIIQTTDTGYIAVGYSQSTDGDVTGNHGFMDQWVVKLNRTGEIEWQKCMGGDNWEDGYAILQTADGGYVTTGSAVSYNGDVSGNHGGWEAWVVKLYPDPNTGIEETNQDESTLSIYPNPFSSATVISFSVPQNTSVMLELFDISGRKVTTLLEKIVETGNHFITYAPDQSAGIYFLQLKMKNEVIVEKVVIE